jgi:hypothetical protein
MVDELRMTWALVNDVRPPLGRQLDPPAVRVDDLGEDGHQLLTVIARFRTRSDDGVAVTAVEVAPFGVAFGEA